ncbi:MAG: Rpn family recombination-promoting nuclease/putative transposase [Rivularia sp. ALOHA_DT_140]|nr:Rpn family recombination-promoting nuclease/putative transposase [Rivularia sp. ALOHA_DT_140]
MFDNICKFLAENFSADFANWLLGEPIVLTELSPKELSLEPIRADALILLQSDEQILHIEFQTQPDPKIPFRMADYRLRGYRRFPEKEMYQVVIYLNRTNSELVYQNTFSLTRTRHEFEVIRLWEQPVEIFLENPGLLAFAVLSSTPNPENVLNQVAAQINEISDNRTQSNVAASTAILASLVLNKDLIKRILRSDVMRESPIYQEILQEGEEKGKAKGREEGRAEGKTEVAINLLSTGMSLEDISRVTGLSIEELRILQRKRGE